MRFHQGLLRKPFGETSETSEKNMGQNLRSRRKKAPVPTYWLDGCGKIKNGNTIDDTKGHKTRSVQK
jgi:hypothetical protein